MTGSAPTSRPGTSEEFAPLDDFEQFVESRRLAQNTLLWQIPGLSLAAQAFLIGSAIDEGSSRGVRIAVGVLALVIALATIQLLMRNRYREHVFQHVLDMSRLRRGVARLDWPDAMEEIAARRDDGFGHDHHWPNRWTLRIARVPGWKTWSVIFYAFIVLDLIVIGVALA